MHIIEYARAMRSVDDGVLKIVWISYDEADNLKAAKDIEAACREAYPNLKVRIRTVNTRADVDN